MAKIKLHSSLEHRKNSKTVMIHSGVTEFNENGETEVDLTDEQLADVLASYEDLSLPVEKSDTTGDEIQHQVDTNELGKSEDESNDIGAAEEEDNDLTSPLHGMKLEELKALAAESGFPEEEWKSLKKAELKAYLTKAAS